MIDQYQEAYEGFKSLVEEGITVEAHSGPNGEPSKVVNTVRDYYDADETACEEHWSGHLSSEGLRCIISVEDVLDNHEDVEDFLFNHLHDLFIKSYDESGEPTDTKDFDDFFGDLDDGQKDDFLVRWIIDEENELDVLRHCINKHAIW